MNTFVFADHSNVDANSLDIDWGVVTILRDSRLSSDCARITSTTAKLLGISLEEAASLVRDRRSISFESFPYVYKVTFGLDQRTWIYTLSLERNRAD